MLGGFKIQYFFLFFFFFINLVSNTYQLTGQQ